MKLLLLFVLAFFSQAQSQFFKPVFVRDVAASVAAGGPAVVCGNNRCESYLGESCTSCPADCGVCPSCNNICGNNRCEPSESGCNCPADCGVCCVDGLCRNGETAITCPQDCTTDLVVYVEDKLAVAPLSGATVYCQSELTLLGNTITAKLLTDVNGTVRFPSLPAGYYTCSASLTNYYPNTVNFQFQAGLYPTPIPETRIQLLNQMGSITGTFRDSNTRGYVRQVNVTCRTNHTSTRTAALWFKPYYKWSSATYFLNDLTGGAYVCDAKKAGYFPATQTASVTVGSNTNLDFQLTPFPVTLSGFVTIRYLNPIRYKPANGTVTCVSTLGAVLNATVLNGNYSFPSLLPETTYWCTVTSTTPSIPKSFTLCEAAPGTALRRDVWLALGLAEADTFGRNMLCVLNVIHQALQLSDEAVNVTRLNVTKLYGARAAALFSNDVQGLVSWLPPLPITNATTVVVTNITDVVFNYLAGIGSTLSYSQWSFYSPVADVLDDDFGVASISGYLRAYQQNCKTLEYYQIYGNATFTLSRNPALNLPCQWQITSFKFVDRVSFPLVRVL